MSWKRHVVAAFVLWHATAVLVAALPSPGQGLNRKNWSDPTVQGEFAAWAARLGLESSALQDQAYIAASALQDAKNAVYEPFGPYLSYTNTAQSWKMFVAAHRFPTHLQLHVQSGERPWELVFEERNPDAAWRSERFSNERMRASVFAWGWPEAKKRWSSACHTFARDLFGEREDIDRVRCRLAKKESPSAAQVLAQAEPEETYVQSVELDRQDVAP